MQFPSLESTQICYLSSDVPVWHWCNSPNTKQMVSVRLSFWFPARFTASSNRLGRPCRQRHMKRQGDLWWISWNLMKSNESDRGIWALKQKLKIQTKETQRASPLDSAGRSRNAFLMFDLDQFRPAFHQGQWDMEGSVPVNSEPNWCTKIL